MRVCEFIVLVCFWDLVNEEALSKRIFLFHVLSDECACNQYKLV